MALGFDLRESFGFSLEVVRVEGFEDLWET